MTMNKSGLINIRSIAIGLIIILALVFLGYRVNTYVLKTKASQTQADLSFSPKSTTAKVNKPASISLLISAKDKKVISGFDVSFLNSGPIEIKSISPPKPFPKGNVSFNSVITKKDRVAYVAIAEDEKLPGVIRIPISVSCLAEGQGVVRIKKDSTQVVGNVEGKAFAMGSVDEAVIFCPKVVDVRQKTEASIFFDPPNINSKIGDSMEFNLIISPPSTPPPSRGKVSQEIYPAPDLYGVSGFEVQLAFDPNLVEVLEIKDPVDSSMVIASPPRKETSPTVFEIPNPSVIVENRAAIGPSIFTKLKKDYDNKKGTINIAYVSIASDTNLPKRPKVGIVMKAKAKGSGTLSFTFNQVVGNIVGDEYKTNTANASYTIGDGKKTVGNVTLSLKVKLQGIQKKPSNISPMKMKVGLGDGQLTQPVYKTANFNVDNQGYWNGSVSFNAIPGTGYKVLIKPSHHLQKKICDTKPTETFPGTYRCDRGKMTLVKGKNALDFSQIYLMVGDLPQQDGIVNSYDIALVRNLLGKTDGESLRLADLNRDGAVNAQDYSLVIAALSIRYDEL